MARSREAAATTLLRTFLDQLLHAVRIELVLPSGASAFGMLRIASDFSVRRGCWGGLADPLLMPRERFSLYGAWVTQKKASLPYG